MTQTELLKTVKASSGMQPRGDKIKAEAYFKVKDKLKPLRDSATFPLTLDGLHEAIKWKEETVKAWKEGRNLVPEQAKGITLTKALEVTDADVKGWSISKTSWRETGLARGQCFVDYFGGNRRLDSISYQDLEKYRQYLNTIRLGKKRGKLQPSTINQYLICVSKIFTICHKQGWIKDYPPQPYESIIENTRRRCFAYDVDANNNVSIDEEAEIYHWCESWGSKFLELKMMIQLAVNTGMREGEIIGFQCRMVNFRNSTITLPAWFTKAKKDRILTMNDTVKAIVRYFMANRIGTQKVIKSHYPAYLERDKKKKDGRHIWDKFKLQRYFNKVREKMGLKGDPDFTFHSSRYTHITRLLENGVPPHVVMKWVGHSKIETTMMYCTQKDTLVAGCAGAITKHPATARNNSPEATTNETVQRDLHINGQWKQNKFGKKK